MKKRHASLLALMAVATVFPAAPSHAASTLVVDDDRVQCPDAAYTSIQAAVNAAVQGDTIKVCPGTYHEIVTVTTSDLTLVGQTTLPQNCDQFAAPDPMKDSIIDVTNPTNEGIVNLEADNIHFQGFTVQNNQGNPTLGGFGIETYNTRSGYVITNNVIQGNPAGMYFNAIGTTQSEVAQNCIRSNNVNFGSASAAGNGIYSDMGLHNALIDNNAFFQNNNSAITITKFDPNTVSQVNVNHNVSHQDGSLVAIFHSTGSQVTDNQAVNNTGSAIFIGNENPGIQVLRNNIQGSFRGLRANTAADTGPASTQATISNNTVSNTVNDGISVASDSLTNSTISNNSVSSGGRDGVFIDDTAGNGGNLVTGNMLQNNVHFDCEDLTTGTGTAGTANTWQANQATTSNPAGLCPALPSLTVNKSHSEDFVHGKTGIYTITVHNEGRGATDGSTVTVRDTLPQGLVATEISGPGWGCNRSTLTCTRSDSLPAGSNYPPITLKVDVPCKAPAQGIDTATVTGGGDSATHTATDPTAIEPGKHCKKKHFEEDFHDDTPEPGETLANTGPETAGLSWAAFSVLGLGFSLRAAGRKAGWRRH
jgi:uncharacterized repeat protein (TIGR01451 family)